MRPKTFLATEHEIDPAQIDLDALAVIRRLQEAGYTAYLVGGSVRDLLTHRTPKDFDISTSAKPEEIKKLFGRQCLLIGRRFRLAHIRFGRKVIEVSTFRSGDNDSDLIIRDNQWGSPEEDVIRRDFTINGLFYDPAEHQVIDYVGGWDDIHKGVLRSIGDPMIRFRQDPVRMIRLIKFRARLDFTIEQETKAALIACRDEIIKSAPARILEELFRMLESGSSVRFFHLMSEANLLQPIIPFLSEAIGQGLRSRIYAFLNAADQLNRDKKLHRATLLSCLLFPLLEKEIANETKKQEKNLTIGEILLLTNGLLQSAVSTPFSRFPKRLAATTSYILAMQFRLTPLSGGKGPMRQKIVRNSEFPLVLELLRVRSLIDAEYKDNYAAWQHLARHYDQQSEHRRRPHPPPSRPRRRRRRRVSTPES